MSFRKKNAIQAKDWAAKRAAQIEHARRLKEERSRGVVEEEHTFEPTFVAKRPSPTNVQPSFRPTYDDGDTLEAYASAVPVPNPRRDTHTGRGGYRELVTFDERGGGAIEAQRHSTSRDLHYDDGPTVSPGSDTLSHEVRRVSGSRGHPGPAPVDDWSLDLRGGGAPPPRRTTHRRPEWNNDFVDDTPPPPAPVEDEWSTGLRDDPPPPRRRGGSASRRAAPPRPQWNDDTTAVSPRLDDAYYGSMREDLTHGRSGGAPPPAPAAAAAAAAAPKLTLLKSKIRRSRSQRSIDAASAGSRRSNTGADSYRDDGDGYGRPPSGRVGLGRPRSGRRVEPEARPPRPAEDYGYDARVEDTPRAVPSYGEVPTRRPRSGRRAVPEESYGSDSSGGGVDVRGGAAASAAPASACTRQSGCPCVACAGAVDLLSMPAPRAAAEATPALPTKQCPDCGRKFSDAAFEKHVRVCKKVFKTKAKPFDMQAARVGGTEAAKFVRGSGGRRGRGGRGRGRGRGGVGASAPAGKKSTWAAKSSALREAMAAARNYKKAIKSGVDPRDIPPPAAVETTDDRIPCPHCGRKFNEVAGLRHIEHCKNTKAKPTRLLRGSGVRGGRVTVAATARRGRVSGSGYGRR